MIRLINKLPGPSLLEIFVELLRLKIDREQFTYQLEVIFRKHAYKYDRGIVSGNMWFKTIRVLTPTFHFNILRKYILLETLKHKYSDTNQTFDLLPYLRYDLDVIAVRGKKQLTFLNFFFNVRDQYNLTDENICDQVNTFMAAMGHRQNYQEKVYEEIKYVLGGYTIPVSTDCYISPFFIMRDPKVC
ncbi:unnamed protein product [Brugia pahangi]|uniref:Uncharacterized protein n=1 Tax=Brugia pahangi TaxID=6280 RepID=A0A0N4TSG7_BRUPA|nr:unnamed protein product [Brugia pahangi]